MCSRMTKTPGTTQTPTWEAQVKPQTHPQTFAKRHTLFAAEKLDTAEHPLPLWGVSATPFIDNATYGLNCVKYCIFFWEELVWHYD